MLDVMKDNILRRLITRFDDYVDEANSLMLPGHNGPYNEQETPLRNTAHWLVILASGCMYDDLREASLANIERLHRGILGFHNSKHLNFISRVSRKPNVDFSNGVIGAAWIFEGLSNSLRVLPNTKLYDICYKIYCNHKFSQQAGLWHRNDPYKGVGRIDQTFNHQLWFAYAASQLFESEARVLADVEVFLDRACTNFGTYENGLIYHPIPYKVDWRSRIAGGVRLLKAATLITIGSPTPQLTGAISAERLRQKSIGYHMFNIFAFLGLLRVFPDHPFFKSDSFKAALRYTTCKEYLKDIYHENMFGFAYNLPGFEVSRLIARREEIRQVCGVRVDTEKLDGLSEMQSRLVLDSNGDFEFEKFADERTAIASIYKILG